MQTKALCCLLSTAILWWIAHSRRWISTESTRTTWRRQAWPSSRVSGMNQSPTHFTTHSVSHTKLVLWPCDRLQKRIWHAQLASCFAEFENVFLSLNNKACLTSCPCRHEGTSVWVHPAPGVPPSAGQVPPWTAPALPGQIQRWKGAHLWNILIDYEMHTHREEDTHLLVEFVLGIFMLNNKAFFLTVFGLHYVSLWRACLCYNLMGNFGERTGDYFQLDFLACVCFHLKRFGDLCCTRCIKLVTESEGAV